MAWSLGVLAVLLAGTAPAQEPLGATHADLRPLSELPVFQTAPVDVSAALARAESKPVPGDPQPLEYAQTFEVDVTPSSAGTWELVDLGDRGRLWVWRLPIESPGALSVNLGFTRYRLPAGARLFVYAPDYQPGASPSQIRRFTSLDNEAHGQLGVPLIRGSRVVVELIVPEARRDQVQLELGAVNGGFRELGPGILSGSCNVDVVCPQGNPYRDPIRAVGVLSINGRSLCTGSLINSTGAKRPLFITANHCGLRANNAATVVVYWNFQNSFCRPVGGGQSGGDGDGQLSQFNSGSNFLATFATSDFTLVELDDPPQAAFNVFLAGWDRRAGPFSDGAVGIHHPGVDEKRISISNQATEDDGGTHHRVWWRPGGIGVTEPGSSGSPVYTKQGRFIGQLTGGGSACGASDSEMWDVYGKLARSWDGGGSASSRVRDHLDPAGSAPTMINGRNWNETTSGNLALNRPATGSAPCRATEGPEKAFNGSVSLGNSDKWCSKVATKQLQVDLGGSFSVGRFVVRHAGAGGESTSLNSRSFNIQVSTNGTSFTTVVTVTGNTASVTTHSITPRAVRYVRLNVTTPTQTTNASARIYELEVYGSGS